ncbi:alkaline phosphatase family protein [Bradyrhizobium huanghuaihaiense]
MILISLDGAKPDFIRQFIDEGVLPRDGGLARLSRHGAVALQNITASPSLTAVSHIEIATGSTAVHNDIPSNTFQAIVGPITSSLSGFAAPIGGYRESPLGPSPRPSALPLWVQLRQQGKKVVTATWPGGDGADISINGTVVQPAQPIRVTDYTVPFGAFGGLGAQGFSLTQTNFAPDPAVAAALQAAGRFSFSPVLATPHADRDVLVRLGADRDLHQRGHAGPQIRDPGGGTRHHQRQQGELRHPRVLRRHARHHGRAVQAAGDWTCLCQARRRERAVLLRGQRRPGRRRLLRLAARARSVGGALCPLRRQLHPAQHARAGRRRRHQQQHRVLAPAGRLPHSGAPQPGLH